MDGLGYTLPSTIDGQQYPAVVLDDFDHAEFVLDEHGAVMAYIKRITHEIYIDSEGNHVLLFHDSRVADGFHDDLWN
jgi:hypothetical protein